MKVADRVYEAILPLFKNDIKLVEVEYVKRQDGMHLIVYIDKPTGVTIDDCENVSNLISPLLDDLDPTDNEPYHLDVSSYGLDKPLKHAWQLKKYLNKKVNVSLYRKIGGRKEFVATLLDFNENDYTFGLDDENFNIDNLYVARITPYIDF